MLGATPASWLDGSPLAARAHEIQTTRHLKFVGCAGKGRTRLAAEPAA
jgi:hypothetical protein